MNWLGPVTLEKCKRKGCKEMAPPEANYCSGECEDEAKKKQAKDGHPYPGYWDTQV